MIAIYNFSMLIDTISKMKEDLSMVNKSLLLLYAGNQKTLTKLWGTFDRLVLNSTDLPYCHTVTLSSHTDG